MGVDLNVFDIGAIDKGDFYVKFHLCNKSDEFKWARVCVYDPAQNDHKERFLAELVHMCSHVSLPVLIRGDFNLLRYPRDKNKDNFDRRWLFLFNAVIRETILIG
jgi:hypothetical protein